MGIDRTRGEFPITSEPPDPDVFFGSISGKGITFDALLDVIREGEGKLIEVPCSILVDVTDFELVLIPLQWTTDISVDGIAVGYPSIS